MSGPAECAGLFPLSPALFPLVLAFLVAIACWFHCFPGVLLVFFVFFSNRLFWLFFPNRFFLLFLCFFLFFFQALFFAFFLFFFFRFFFFLLFQIHFFACFFRFKKKKKQGLQE